VFNRLMTGLESQLGGMGVAFGSSLLGLAGSLIVGLLELFAGHGQNRFYRELEEWLSSITRVGFASSSGEEGGSDTEAAGMVWVMDQLADQVDTMQQTFVSAEHSRAQVDEKLGALSDAISDLAARLEPEETDTSASTEALLQVAQGQEKIVAALEHRPQHDSGDTEARMRLRSIDVQMLRILEEISAGRQESTTELRTDLRALIEVLQNTGADIRRLRGLPPEQD
jgi:chromosome segregation ATPase